MHDPAHPSAARGIQQRAGAVNRGRPVADRAMHHRIHPGERTLHPRLVAHVDAAPRRPGDPPPVARAGQHRQRRVSGQMADDVPPDKPAGAGDEDLSHVATASIC